MTRLLPQKGLRYNPALRKIEPPFQNKESKSRSWHIVSVMKEDPEGEYVRCDEIEFVKMDTLITKENLNSFNQEINKTCYKPKFKGIEPEKLLNAFKEEVNKMTKAEEFSEAINNGWEKRRKVSVDFYSDELREADIKRPTQCFRDDLWALVTNDGNLEIRLCGTANSIPIEAKIALKFAQWIQDVFGNATQA